MKLISTKTFYDSSHEDLPWIIDPFAMRGSTMLLYGRQGIGKSSLAWQLAHAVSTGGAWLGHPILRPGPVVYLNLDMPHLEFRRMLERATDAGMPPTERILMPEVGDIETFDILRNAEGLIESCLQHEPRALIVDTVLDGFQPAIRDINAEVRVVIGRFKRAVPQGLLLMLLHDRKKAPAISFEINENDDDAYLGPTAWEAKATSSFRITASSNGLKFHVKKSRLDEAPYKELPLQRTKDGFFEPKRTFVHSLHEWAGTAQNLAQVFEAIAKEHGERPDTVRQAYYRAVKRGSKFAWADSVTGAVTGNGRVTTEVVESKELKSVTPPL